MGEEFGFGAGTMEMLGFAEKIGELHVLGLALGRVEALSPCFPSECGHDLVDDLGEQIGRNDLQPERRKVVNQKMNSSQYYITLN